MRRGGCAVRKCREATEAAQTGWSLTTQVSGMHSGYVACERPPRPLQVRWLRTIFLDVASTPPHGGGECCLSKPIHSHLQAEVFKRVRRGSANPGSWVNRGPDVFPAGPGVHVHIGHHEQCGVDRGPSYRYNARSFRFFSHAGGEFHWLHMVATDSKGNVYTGEVDTGKRVLRFLIQQ